MKGIILAGGSGTHNNDLFGKYILYTNIKLK